MMVVAFVAGQIAASFVDPAFTHGAWPMVVPMGAAGIAIMAIAFLWLPRIHSSFKKEIR
jgi:DHA1 family bicyclomycin/chloramphenicol resistance-like MFS transporter